MTDATYTTIGVDISHYEPTATLAYMNSKEVERIQQIKHKSYRALRDALGELCDVEGHQVAVEIDDLDYLRRKCAEEEHSNEYKQLPEIRMAGNTVHVELLSPPMTYQFDDRFKYVEVDMCAVRASDGIRISYDFARDGWKIEQAQKFEFPYIDGKPDPVCDPEWTEVAFVQAWGSQRIPAQECQHEGECLHGRE